MEKRPLHLLLVSFSPWMLLLLVVQGVRSLQFRRDDFPDGFLFGAGTSAYQYEGAAAEDGRTPSIWDTYTHSGRHPEDGTGDVASDGYHKYKEDVKLMSEIGLEVVLHHMDLPQSLQDEYGGWINPKVVDDFTAYADVCFREFGDRVAHWTTVLEPNIMAQSNYDIGILPPNRCSYPFGSNCTGGNSTVEPYLFIHYSLLAHASAVRLYREKYQAAQNGIIGINMYSMWFYPFTYSAEDIGATERTKQILHPLVFGDYPETIKKVVGSRLPIFSNHESKMVTNAFDFIGLNHYTSVYTSNNNNVVKTPLQDLTADIATLFRVTKNDTPTSEFSPGPTVDPQGLEHALEYIRENYGNLPIYIQENGSGTPDGTLDDVERINCLAKYIAATLKAIRNGANVKGYSMWSFMDLYELFGGYNNWHYGLIAVDFGSAERRRQPRRSASWYSDFLKNNAVIKVEDGFFTRDDFPDGFTFGAGTAAYQYEGAASEDGKSPSIWDTFTHSGRHPEDGTGDVACDGYHKYKEDVKMLSEAGLEAYSDDFTAYADVRFREIGDRVAHWTTVLEPNIMAQGCYDSGDFPPNRCSYPFGSNCTGGNSTVEPYLFMHHFLLAHASAARLYREKYQAAQKGIIGINMYSLWFYPFTDSTEDIGATERVKQFIYDWILHPLVFGDYPETIKKVAGSRLPFFSNHESELVANAFDFIGLNHYSSVYTSNNNNIVKAPLQDLAADIATLFRVTKNDTPTPKFLPGNAVDPKGLENALEYIRENYGNMPIYIQENGRLSFSNLHHTDSLHCQLERSEILLLAHISIINYIYWHYIASGREAPDGTLDDVDRINYLSKYISATLRAIRNGANVKGYSMWSFMDLYELFGGYNTGHYGLVAVDFNSAERRRQPRRSASWYSNFLKNNAVIYRRGGCLLSLSCSTLGAATPKPSYYPNDMISKGVIIFKVQTIQNSW
uniref:Uncharacterized protein n=1 Tax=Oryza punctata TaxID=4537 RepID=A0A0E0L1M4_ORYPU